MKRTLRVFRALVLLCLCVTLPLCAEAPVDPVLNGAVLDPSGAAIPHATIRLHNASGDHNAIADDAGQFSLTAPPATYSITVDSPGFRSYTRDAFVVAPAHNSALNITLEIATDTVEVSVSGNDGLSTDAAGNKNALIFKEDKLDTFSDDPAINITTGTDLNGDTQYNDRPAFATDLSRPSVVRTACGNFDTSPLPGQIPVPINDGNGPGLMYLEISAGKSFRFGPRAPAPAGAAPAGGKPAPLPPQKYRLQFGFEADNPLNHVNKGAPVGVLSSPLFGKSTSLNNQFNGGNSASRVITFHTGFYF